MITATCAIKREIILFLNQYVDINPSLLSISMKVSHYKINFTDSFKMSLELSLLISNTGYYNAFTYWGSILLLLKQFGI